MLSLRRGQRPWSPHPDAQVVDSFLHYQVPLCGLFSLEDEVYMFSCMHGDLDEDAIWSYAPVSQSVLPHVQQVEFDTPSDLRAWVDDYMNAFALAVVKSVNDEITQLFYLSNFTSKKSQIEALVRNWS